MRNWIIVGAIILAVQAANAGMVDISGKITKEGSGDAIAGAWVSLKSFPPRIEDLNGHDYYHAIRCLTDASGNFHLVGDTGKVVGVTVNPRLNPGSRIVIRSAKGKAGLSVGISAQTRTAGIVIFGIDGRMIASKRFTGSSRGDLFIPLSRVASAIYFVKVSVDGQSRMFKTVPGTAFECAVGAEGARTASSLGKTAAVSDTLVVVATGFKTINKAIQSYTSTVAIPATASNPWTPAGALEHDKGQVKILAKGHDFEMGQPCDTVRGIFFSMPTTDIEQPVHTVSFTHDFWMDTAEVQQGEYDSLMKLTYPGKYKGCGWNASNGMGREVAVYSVLWGDAALFCNARSKAFGLPDTAYSYDKIIGTLGNLCTLKNVKVNWAANAFRLPTEAEWEYAARGGTTGDYYWGKNYDDYRAGEAADVGDYTVWYRNSAGLGKDNSDYGAHKTGRKKPNKYGLYDMLGNVSEWCNDWWEPYRAGPATDPQGAVEDQYSVRVQRGGNWGNETVYLRVTSREFATTDYPYFFMGFRTAKQIQ
jgi:formylglycine-generating enzyme required for sulfatase activity